jgi:SAM-dependent methyltransferase
MGALRIPDLFRSYRMLCFGLGEVAPKGWFREAEAFRAPTSELYDPATDTRPDGSFDVIACSHALEYVPDANKALTGLARLLSPRGFMYLAYANPTANGKSREWDQPQPEQNGRYRILGRDYERWFERLVPDAIAMRIYGRDAVTDSAQICYILTKSPFWMRRAFASDLDTTILGVG